ncbi:putative tetratricopeptide-like helical domain superfamily, DYW domain-containing protein [Helianthus annuus]|uniref:pentatricopeptide repeat-containing protein At3g47530 n=1 Tax=Helianthus annuus TaxID=4232 RepID=UPI000B8F2A14|nr:pentatricopeptide repeat-containing protein At3g47530 [Helianthus annuus]KAJ0527619.1 putative tetratricopeptide-like helical domain superfamily, DYW domain-containing protein [Helianthus annuus]KAJ0544025.1 putative tetratricopeptide-like helical domain superfamily, DYW domain-containing protein [Helianthus annuus]
MHSQTTISRFPSLSTQTHFESLISFIKSTTKTTQLLQIHAYLLRTSLIQNTTFSVPFLNRISLPPLQNLTYSLRTFSQISRPIVTHYNTIIRAYAMSKYPEKGFYVYRDMMRKGKSPNSQSLSFVTKCCTKGCSVFGGLQVHARILRDGYCSDTLLLTTLMEFYSGGGKGDDACKVFDEMPQRDTVAWNVLVSCYTRNGRTRDALDVFDRMQRGEHGCDPDDVTCLLVLQACSNMCAFEFGERVHRYVKDHGYSHALNICNSLVAMYSKCGQLDKAYEVFQEIPNKDVVSWTAMISGFASNGRGREAINVFREMQRMGISPDEQTFTALLSGCSHSGLLDEGRSIFDRMQREFGLVPNIHHYGCVVDLMGRVGLVEDAYELIVSMNCKPDATIWRTLLGACKVHGNLTLGERVIERLIELKAQEAGDYILLLNIYSSAGNLEKVIELRKLMKEKGIQTTPSASTIELKGEIHEFKVDDTSHPRINEVYEILDEIEKQLKIGGYIAEITDVRLSYHSEKLAMAFGVLATPPGTKIRVAKDLRICTDCHNFAKMLSAVYSREVTIRDRTRFHHFREGRCSCNDFW